MRTHNIRECIAIAREHGYTELSRDATIELGTVAIELQAAPELLAACRALLETTAANLDDQEPADLAVYAAARAAIAKATK